MDLRFFKCANCFLGDSTDAQGIQLADLMSQCLETSEKEIDSVDVLKDQPVIAEQAFDGFISAAQQAVSTFEGQAESARKGARTVAEKAMSFAEQNVAKSFELAQQLVRAKDVQEVLKLQGDFIRTQMQLLSEQARELGESAGQAAKDAASPPKP